MESSGIQYYHIISRYGMGISLLKYVMAYPFLNILTFIQGVIAYIFGNILCLTNSITRMSISCETNVVCFM